MKTVFLLRAFDLSSFWLFQPDPAIFETQEEAEAFCENNTTSSVMYSYEPISASVGTLVRAIDPVYICLVAMPLSALVATRRIVYAGIARLSMPEIIGRKHLMGTKMLIDRMRAVADEVRAMSDDAVETEYRRLRDKLHNNYQMIAGSIARARRAEIVKLHTLGGNHGEKATRLEAEYETEQDQYDVDAERKSIMAVRTGRLDFYQISSIRFTGKELVESRHGSDKFDNCGDRA